MRILQLFFIRSQQITPARNMNLSYDFVEVKFSFLSEQKRAFKLLDVVEVTITLLFEVWEADLCHVRIGASFLFHLVLTSPKPTNCGFLW